MRIFPAVKKTTIVAFVLLCVTFLRMELYPADAWNHPPLQITLSTGIPLIYHFDATSRVTVFHILMMGGKQAEPPGKEGLSYLTTRLMLEIPDDLKLKQLMGQATRISMTAESDYSLISISSLSENLEDALKVMTDILYKPLFSGIRISSLKSMMNAQRESGADDPRNIAYVGHRDRLFAGTAYCGSVFGSKKSLKSIKKKDIDLFYDTYFHAANLKLMVTSDLEQTMIEELCEKYLSKVPEGTVEMPSLAERKTGDEDIPEEIHRDVQQNLISYAYPLEGASVEGAIRAELLETLLGQGIGSRLWHLRAEEKLAYYVEAQATLMREGGVLEIFLETDESKKTAAESSLTEVLDELLSEGIDEEELVVTKTYAMSAFLRRNENKTTRARTFSSFLALGFDIAFLREYFRLLDEVSLDEMNVFIRTVLDPAKRSRIIVGPAPSKDAE
jgi:zinc protease